MSNTRDSEGIMKLAKYQTTIIFKFLFSIIFTVFFTIQAKAREVIVLVPGFFNSFAPEYFSQDIIRSFEDKGFKVYVAKNLNPIGTIEDNGQRLEKFLSKIEADENSKISFNLVAHSAGGFYSFFAANRQKFDIKNILTISTPYKGIEIQRWLDDPIVSHILTEHLHLGALTQLTKSGVAKFLNGLRISPKTKVTAFGGYQNKNINIWDAQFLSPPLSVTSDFISEISDGIVGYSSALGLNNVPTTDETINVQIKKPNYFFALEHWEQVLDSNSFLILGIFNLSYIRREQIRFYSGLADYLLKTQ